MMKQMKPNVVTEMNRITKQKQVSCTPLVDLGIVQLGDGGRQVIWHITTMYRNMSC